MIGIGSSAGTTNHTLQNQDFYKNQTRNLHHAVANSIHNYNNYQGIGVGSNLNKPQIFQRMSYPLHNNDIRNSQQQAGLGMSDYNFPIVSLENYSSNYQQNDQNFNTANINSGSPVCVKSTRDLNLNEKSLKKKLDKLNNDNKNSGNKDSTNTIVTIKDKDKKSNRSSGKDMGLKSNRQNQSDRSNGKNTQAQNTKQINRIKSPKSGKKPGSAACKKGLTKKTDKA